MSGIETAALIGMGAAAAGTVVSTVGALQQGAAQEAAMKAQAQARERQANEQRAVAQREAIARKENAQLLLSSQQAAAAGSGAGASDKTVMDLMGDTAAEGEYQARSAIYEGEVAGQGAEYQARIDRMNARQARLSSYIDAGSTMLSGIGYGAQAYGKAAGAAKSKQRANALRYG